MKLYNQKLVLYEMKTLEQAGTVRTLRESDLLSWEAKTTLLDTSYSGCRCSTSTPTGKR